MNPMFSFEDFMSWFLGYTGAVIAVGFMLSLLLSPLVIDSAVLRSRCEMILSVIIAVLGSFQPVFTDGPEGHYLPYAVVPAFGIAFTITWLRFTGARSVIAWLCLVMHFFNFAFAVQRL